MVSYLGRPFNSVNDVVIHIDGSIWFTSLKYVMPDKIKCDTYINSGCGDGINVWSAGGVLLGKVLILGEPPTLFRSRRRLVRPERSSNLKTKVNPNIKGALLGD
uniref:SMP-30/Gluconolactonase/LRE-like region domain-containing protein n=1 Tax=Bionectria ochroleuca TaxID=29856 RepID=A0A0B7JWZ3_BIOOC